MPRRSIRETIRNSPLFAVAATVGTLLLAYVPFGLVLLVVAVLAGEISSRVVAAFAVPASLALVAGLVLRLITAPGPIRSREALLVVVAGWTCYALLGALPLSMLLGTAIAAMLAGGVNFFVHFRVLRGELSALWDSSKSRLYWSALIVVTALVVAGIILSSPDIVAVTEEHVRTATFQAASLLSSTGYGTRGLSSPFFPLVARPLHLRTIAGADHTVYCPRNSWLPPDLEIREGRRADDGGRRIAPGDILARAWRD